MVTAGRSQCVAIRPKDEFSRRGESFGLYLLESLAAGVPYYGRQLPAEQVPDVTAPLCLQYAGLDERINAGIAEYEAALKANNKPYEIYVYDGVNHAFNNDTNETRYDREAADLAWSRTIAFLKKHLAS